MNDRNLNNHHHAIQRNIHIFSRKKLLNQGDSVTRFGEISHFGFEISFGLNGILRLLDWAVFIRVDLNVDLL